MSGAIINLIIQIVGGAIGGNAVGGLFKNIVLSPLLKTISGASAGGGITGAIVTAAVGLIKNALFKKA